MLTLPGKTSVFALVCAAALPLTQDSDLPARVTELERAQKKAGIEFLECRARVEALERWQKVLARQGEALQQALTAVDAAGFTKAGVNSSAREQLLQALRAFGVAVSAQPAATK